MDEGTVRRWSEATVVGIVVYVGLDVALVFLRPALSVLHNAESDYGSAGAWGWVMDANFVLRCLLSLALVGALQIELGGRALRAGGALLGLWALCSGLLALFPDDPVGTATHGAGRIHVALAAVAFVCVVAGTFVTTWALRAEERFAPQLVPLGVLASAAVVCALLLGHARLAPHSLGGLYEKLFLACELAWFACVALRLSRLPPAAAGEEPAPR